MSRAQIRRTVTIGDERVRADLDAEGNLIITNMERGSIAYPGKRFAATDSIVISSTFAGPILAALRGLPSCDCGGFFQSGAFVHAERCARGKPSKDLVDDLRKRYVAAIESGEPWDSPQLAREIRAILPKGAR